MGTAGQRHSKADAKLSTAGVPRTFCRSREFQKNNRWCPGCFTGSYVLLTACPVPFRNRIPFPNTAWVSAEVRAKTRTRQFRGGGGDAVAGGGGGMPCGWRDEGEGRRCPSCMLVSWLSAGLAGSSGERLKRLLVCASRLSCRPGPGQGADKHTSPFSTQEAIAGGEASTLSGMSLEAHLVSGSASVMWFQQGL